MALIVEGQIELDNGITLSSCYARTTYRVNDSSNEVVILVEYWQNEDSYTMKKPLGLSLNIPLRYSYNRDIDGVDILSFTQIKIKEQLENLGYSVVITGIE